MILLKVQLNDNFSEIYLDDCELRSKHLQQVWSSHLTRKNVTAVETFEYSLNLYGSSHAGGKLLTH